MLLTPRQLEALQKDYRTALKLAFWKGLKLASLLQHEMLADVADGSIAAHLFSFWANLCPLLLQ